LKNVRVEPIEELEAQEEEEKYYCEVCGREISEENARLMKGSAGNAGTTK